MRCNRSKILFVCCLSLAHSLTAQSAAPSWYFDKELQFPSRSYIAASGEGKTRAEAEASALAGVSMFFNTRADLRNQVIREFNEAVVNNTTAFSGKTYVNENALISSEADFLGVRFAAPWQNPATQTWAALAYIDRKEAAGIYESKINANMAAIESLAADADREKEDFYGCSLLSQAVSIGNVTGELIQTAAAVDSGAAAKYAPFLDRLRGVSSRYRTKRESLTFGVRVSGGDSSGRIARKLKELFEQRGYVVNERTPRYRVSAALIMNEEDGSAYIFIRPGIQLGIEGAAGKVLFSYSKNYQKVGHQTIAGAYNRALLAIEQDLQENFMEELTAMTGR